MGVCFDCLVVVDGVPNTRACMTSVAEGMAIRRQEGLTPPRRAAEALGIRVWKSSTPTQVGRTAIRAMRVPGWSIWAR